MQQLERKDYRQRVLNTGDTLGRGKTENLVKSFSSNLVHNGVCSTTTQHPGALDFKSLYRLRFCGSAKNVQPAVHEGAGLPVSLSLGHRCRIRSVFKPFFILFFSPDVCMKSPLAALSSAMKEL